MGIFICYSNLQVYIHQTKPTDKSWLKLVNNKWKINTMMWKILVTIGETVAWCRLHRTDWFFLTNEEFYQLMFQIIIQLDHVFCKLFSLFSVHVDTRANRFKADLLIKVNTMKSMHSWGAPSIHQSSAVSCWHVSDLLWSQYIMLHCVNFLEPFPIPFKLRRMSVFFKILNTFHLWFKIRVILISFFLRRQQSECRNRFINIHIRIKITSFITRGDS